MKLECRCGHVILDIIDYLSNKAHVIPEQLWLDLLDAIDAAIENPGGTDKARETACMSVRKKLNDSQQTTWQCEACGRLYIDDKQGRTQSFDPTDEGASTQIFCRF